MLSRIEGSDERSSREARFYMLSELSELLYTLAYSKRRKRTPNRSSGHIVGFGSRLLKSHAFTSSKPTTDPENEPLCEKITF